MKIEHLDKIEPLFLRAFLRGGGSDEHARMKIAAWYWLTDQQHEIIDFEIGGFDVLGMMRRQKKSDQVSRMLSGRIVVDAKTSMSDVYNHFKKNQIQLCDIDGKFSEYANFHYLIAKSGIVKVDSVHEPWGLLEYTDGMVKVTKVASPRVYIGSGKEAEDVAVQFGLFLRSMFQYPKSWNVVKEVIEPKVLLDEKKASTQIILSHRDLMKAITSFQYLYGYNPLKNEIEG